MSSFQLDTNVIWELIHPIHHSFLSKMLRATLFMGAAGFFFSPGGSLAAEHVPARQAAAVAESLIDGAAEEVRAYLYLFTVYPNQPHSWPMRLARALGRARARGARVEVVLEGSPANENALAALRRENVPVFLAEGPLLHAKALVVDGAAVLTGSSNWTGSAFAENAEVNVLIRSTAVARAVLDELAALPRRPPPTPAGPPPVPVPVPFLMGAMGSMVNNKDSRALDAYLYFLSVGFSTAAAPVDMPALCRVLGWPHDGVSRQQARELLRRLRDKYSVIDLTEGGKEEPRMALRPAQGEETVLLPADYFSLGWPGRLTLAGKVFYLISLHRSGASPVPSSWALGQESLARLYNASVAFLQKGVRDLRRRNLLKVVYDDIPINREERRSVNVYTLSPLYDPSDIEPRLRSFASEHGAPALARARQWAALVYEDDDMGAVDALLRAERDFGRAVVEKAAAVMREKAPDNPKRNFGYFWGTIRRMAAPPPENKR